MGAFTGFLHSDGVSGGKRALSTESFAFSLARSLLFSSVRYRLIYHAVFLSQ